MLDYSVTANVLIYPDALINQEKGKGFIRHKGLPECGWKEQFS